MIRFDSVCLTRKNKALCFNLNIGVGLNEKVLIWGKSGTGKTTLLKSLLGFESLDSGRIEVNGIPVDRFHIHDIRKQIFYLSQDVDLKKEKVGSLLDEVFLYNPEPSNRKEALPELLDFMDLGPDILEQNIKKLSGGERQRIGLLIGFLLDRPIWLLDEPTASLDPAMKQKVVSRILDLEKTVIIVSHDDVWQNNPRVRLERWN